MSKSLRTTFWCTRNSVFIPNLLSFSKHPENGFTVEGAYDRIRLCLHLSSITIPGHWQNFKPPTRILFKFNHFSVSVLSV